ACACRGQRGRRTRAVAGCGHTSQDGAVLERSRSHLTGRAVIRNARYVHTNVVARDWRALARFYQEVFGCRPVGPERHLSGAELEAGTGIAGARIDGVHLRLPGGGDAGPTLEIFEYGRAGADAA